MEDYSKLEGKKVLVINGKWRDEANLVETGVVVGCEPGVGICVMEEGNLQGAPIAVFHGPLSPKNKGLRLESFRVARMQKTFGIVVNQIKSGYISFDEVFKSHGPGAEPDESKNPACPFRM